MSTTERPVGMRFWTRARGSALAAAALALLCVGNCSRVSVPAAAPPDILLVTIDTLRADAVGFMGGPDGVTPALDRLAEGGRVFEFAHAHNVVTLPSMSSVGFQ